MMMRSSRWRLFMTILACPLDYRYGCIFDIWCDGIFIDVDIKYRYGCDDFKIIWSEEGRHSRQLEVERALIWAHWQLGRVSEADYRVIESIAVPEKTTKERVSEIEAETRHDIMALTKAMAESAGDAGWCIHLGATSNDIVDTAVALQLRDSITLLRQQLCNLMTVTANLAQKERDTVMLGRTHGQAAVPITFGLKVAVWLDELRRHLIRLDEAIPRICVGKFLGAVGTGAAQGKDARKLQQIILEHLGLGVPLATTQVVGRDRYIEYMGWLCNVSTTCEKILQEVRNLQRSEIAEAGEGFDVKRFTLSHASILLEDVLAKTSDVLTNLWVDSDRMQKNIADQKGLLMAEKVMLELVDKGVSRDEAHEILRNASMKAIAEKRELQEICADDDVVASRFSEEELNFMFDPKNHIGVSGELVDEAVALARSMVLDS